MEKWNKGDSLNTLQNTLKQKPFDEIFRACKDKELSDGRKSASSERLAIQNLSRVGFNLPIYANTQETVNVSFQLMCD